MTPYLRDSTAEALRKSANALPSDYKRLFYDQPENILVGWTYAAEAPGMFSQSGMSRRKFSYIFDAIAYYFAKHRYEINTWNCRVYVKFVWKQITGLDPVAEDRHGTSYIVGEEKVG